MAEAASAGRATTSTPAMLGSVAPDRTASNMESTDGRRRVVDDQVAAAWPTSLALPRRRLSLRLPPIGAGCRGEHGSCCRRHLLGARPANPNAMTPPAAPNPSNVSCTVAVLSQTSTSPLRPGDRQPGARSSMLERGDPTADLPSPPWPSPIESADRAHRGRVNVCPCRVHADHGVRRLEDEPAIVVGSGVQRT